MVFTALPPCCPSSELLAATSDDYVSVRRGWMKEMALVIQSGRMGEMYLTCA